MAANIRVAPTAANRALKLLRSVQARPPACPCHSNPGHHHGTPSPFRQGRRSFATPVDSSSTPDYAFEMAASSIRFGPGCTKEVGMDLKNMGSLRVCVVTDKNVAKLDAMRQVSESLNRSDVDFTIFDKTLVEPKDYS